MPTTSRHSIPMTLPTRIEELAAITTFEEALAAVAGLSSGFHADSGCFREARVRRFVMSATLVRSFALLAVGLLVGTALPAVGQTIDVVPAMPPAPDCPAPTTGSVSAGDATVSASPAPAPDPDAPVVAALPPDRRATPERLPLWRGSGTSHGSTVAIAPRTGGAVATWPEGPFRTILWGGVGADGRLLNDGVMIDDSGWTRVLPAAPICPRRDFAWTTAGDGVVIWGGTDDAGRPFGDGATYSFHYGTWRLLPPSPLPPGPAVGASDAILVRDPATGRALLSRIGDLPDGPVWTAPVEVPLPVGERYELVCCGRAGLTVLSIQPDGFAYAASRPIVYPGDGDWARMEEGAWTQLGRVPVPSDAGGPVTAQATERDLTAWVGASDEAYPGTDVSGAYGLLMTTDHPAKPWRLTAPAPEAAVGDPSLVLSPTHLISAQGMVAYDLMGERWLRLPPRRYSDPRFGPLEGMTAWWTDGKLWVFGGRAPDGSMESRLRTFTPRLPRDTRALTYRPDLFGYLEGCVAVGTEGTWRLRGSLDDPSSSGRSQARSARTPTGPRVGWLASTRGSRSSTRADGCGIATAMSAVSTAAPADERDRAVAEANIPPGGAASARGVHHRASLRAGDATVVVGAGRRGPGFATAGRVDRPRRPGRRYGRAPAADAVVARPILPDRWPCRRALFDLADFRGDLWAFGGEASAPRRLAIERLRPDLAAPPRPARVLRGAQGDRAELGARRCDRRHAARARMAGRESIPYRRWAWTLDDGHGWRRIRGGLEGVVDFGLASDDRRFLATGGLLGRRDREGRLISSDDGRDWEERGASPTTNGR